ncbi:MAG: DUF2079 domain-containing protein [Thermoplasmataceae archaeon]
MRYIDFFTENWDMGINMQQLWTTTHGYLLYDSGDFEWYGVLSHLEVHSTFIAYPISYIYAIFPGPIILFTIQSFVVFLSVPVLYLLSFQITQDRRMAVMSSLIYGFNATLITAVLYDYHWLSFMPILSFSFFYFVLKKNYFIASLILILGLITEEAFSFISISILIYVYMGDIGFSLREIMGKAREGSKLILLFILSVSLFMFLSYIQHYLIPSMLNNSSAISVLLSKTGQPLFPPSDIIYKLPGSLMYWFLSISMLCFIPLFHKKTIYLAFIWLTETLLFVPHYATIGNQYSFVTLSLLAPAIPMGLQAIKKSFSGYIRAKGGLFLPLIPIGYIIASSTNGFSMRFMTLQSLVIAAIVTITIIIIMAFIIAKQDLKKIYRILNRRKKAVYITFITLILFMNFLFSPLNPENDNQAHLLGGGSKFKYYINPESKFMINIQDKVGTSSTIVSSNNLFPYVANDKFAYGLSNSSRGGTTFFPFNNTYFPTYILLSASQENYAFSWVLNDLPKYGIVEEIIYNEYPGNITLWQLGFNGTPTYYYA